MSRGAGDFGGGAPVTSSPLRMMVTALGEKPKWTRSALEDLRDRHHRDPSIEAGHDARLHEPPDAATEVRVDQRPLFAVHMMDQRDHSPAPAKDSGKRQSVDDVDHDIGPSSRAEQHVGKAPGVDAESPATPVDPYSVHHLMTDCPRGARGAQGDGAAMRDQFARNAVDIDLGPTGFGVTGVAPRQERDPVPRPFHWSRKAATREHRDSGGVGLLLMVNPISVARAREPGVGEIAPCAAIQSSPQ